MKKFFKKIKQRANKMSGKHTDHKKNSGAIVPEQENPSPSMVQEKASSENSGKLVVIGRESTFSKEIIDYSIEMAERMSYEIVALNAAPLSSETFKLFSSSRNQICIDFQSLSEENVKEFKALSEKKEIPFTHLVKFNESGDVLTELRDEIGEFEFVVSENEEETVSRTTNEERVKSEIFVYSML